MAEAGDLFHNKTHPTNLPCFETTALHLPISAETLTSSTTKKMDPTITHVTRSGDIHRFTVAHPAVACCRVILGPFWCHGHGPTLGFIRATGQRDGHVLGILATKKLDLTINNDDL
jgi:hypothetical protein